MNRRSIIRTAKPADSSRYAYATGRIRALESHLAGYARLSRYFEARSTGDVARLLQEDGYPAAPDPETSLEMEIEAIFSLVRSLARDPAVADLFLLFRDFHNLKIMLKTFSVYWPRRDDRYKIKSALAIGHTGEDNGWQQLENGAESADHPNQADLWPAIHGPVTFEQIAHLLQKPSIVDPRALFDALREQKAGDIPPELAAAAAAAAARYRQTYDVGEIDITLDKTLYRIVADSVKSLNSPFMTDFFSLKADLINVGMLLRTRFLQSGADYLRHILLPGGRIAQDKLTDLYDDSDEAIAKFLSSTRLSPAAEAAGAFSAGGSAIARFSLASDNLVIRTVRKAREVLRGPEVLVGYLVAREMEARTIRIVLTCLRNGLPADKARELARMTYL